MVDIWNTIVLEPILNSLVALCSMLANNFGLAIIVLTIVVRLVLMPLTMRQTQSTKAMQSLQPKMQEVQKKYARNQQKLQQEMMKLYKEAGINPLGCIWPMLIQMPIWLRLSKPDPNMILAILVGGTMWVQQKMVTPPPTDPRQQSMTSMTTLMMPLMFGMLTLSFPSGLALYWAVSNIIGIVIQYFVGGGWGYLTAPKPAPVQPVQKPPAAGQQAKSIRKASEQSEVLKKASGERRGLFRR